MYAPSLRCVQSPIAAKFVPMLPVPDLKAHARYSCSMVPMGGSKQNKIFLHKTCQCCEENHFTIVKKCYNYTCFLATRTCQHNSQVNYSSQHFQGGKIDLAYFSRSFGNESLVSSLVWGAYLTLSIPLLKHYVDEF